MLFAYRAKSGERLEAELTIVLDSMFRCRRLSKRSALLLRIPNRSARIYVQSLGAAAEWYSTAPA